MYDNNMNCQWVISADAGFSVLLAFQRFDLEDSNPCLDWVRLFDGTAVLGTFCGSTLPRELVSTTSSVTLEFVSDASVVGRGFAATYTAGESTLRCWRAEHTLSMPLPSCHWQW